MKLRPGNPVYYDGQEATIIENIESVNYVKIKLRRPGLFHGILTVPRDSLSEIRQDEPKCPKCFTIYKKTQSNTGEIWYDCLKCGKKREDIEEEAKNNSKHDDALDQWRLAKFCL